MSKENINITKVKLRNGGRKGLVVDYTREKERKGFNFTDEHKGVKFNAPVPESMLKIFRDLKPAMMSFMNYPTESLSEDAKSLAIDSKETQIYEDISVTGLHRKGEQVMLIGQIQVSDKKFANLNTPFIEIDDEVMFYDMAVDLSEKLFELTEEYIDEGRIANNKEIVKMMAPTEVAEKTEEMSPEDLQREAAEILENSGAIVMMPDDYEDGNKEDENQNQRQESKEEKGPEKKNQEKKNEDEGKGSSEELKKQDDASADDIGESDGEEPSWTGDDDREQKEKNGEPINTIPERQKKEPEKSGIENEPAW